jgi:hypothetical protein
MAKAFIQQERAAVESGGEGQGSILNGVLVE